MKGKSSFQTQFEKEIRPQVKKDLGVKNDMAVPKFAKVVLNVGLKQGIKDPKFVEAAERTLTRISGQRPVKTLAKKSISNFKIRQGMVVGMMVTLRGHRMYDFINKLINVTLPRVRDFRGLSPKTVDAHGNLSIGFREFIAFPEIRPEDTDYMHGLEVAVVTTARERKRGLALFRAAGFPFREDVK
ncbi:MAG: 50S ribosomal protein L5 [Patescibacteria group bacterium]|nr:50S ribosomal protein L5 [Patescibacteria group bacterium]